MVEIKENEWQPIDTYTENLWDSDIVLFRASDGSEKIGSYGFEDESCDEEGGVSVWGDYHDENGDPLGFDPVEWKMIQDREPKA